MELSHPFTEEAAMTFDDYLLRLFYLVDTEYEALHLGRLRRRAAVVVP